MSEISPQQRDHLLDLLDLLRDRSLDAAQEAELHRLVTTDDAAAGLYVEHMQLTAALRWRHASPSFAEPVTLMPAGRSWSMRLTPWLAIAAAVAIAGVAATVYMAGRGDTEPLSADERAAVAVLLESDGVAWVSEPIGSGASMRPGRIAIDAGQIEFESKTGVSLRLTGPADLELAAADRVTLRRGRLEANADHGAAGFTVAAPRGVEIVDLSTAFSVDVDDAGASQVAVTAGAVDVNATEAQQRYTLAKGWTARLVDGRFESIRSPGRSVTLTPEADTYVDRRYPEKPLGEEQVIVANEWPSSGPRWAYLRFDLSGVSGVVVAAKLEMTTAVGQSAPDAYDVYGLPGSIDWSESGPDAMTWNTAPLRADDRIDVSQTYAAAPLARFTTTALKGQPVTAFDASGGPLVELLADDPDRRVTLVIAAPPDAATATGDAWASRQSQTPPTLTLTVVDPIDLSTLWTIPQPTDTKETTP